MAFLAIASGASAVVCAGLIWLLWPVLRRYALARPNARSSHTRADAARRRHRGDRGNARRRERRARRRRLSAGLGSLGARCRDDARARRGRRGRRHPSALSALASRAAGARGRRRGARGERDRPAAAGHRAALARARIGGRRRGLVREPRELHGRDRLDHRRRDGADHGRPHAVRRARALPARM